MARDVLLVRAAALVAAVLAAAGCATAPHIAPVAVPLKVMVAGARLGVAVQIGGKTLTLLVDTGSSGLRVPASRIPAGSARILGPAPPNAYGSGARFHGHVALARLRIGTVDSPGPVPIELVTSIDCVPNKPDCPHATDHSPDATSGPFDGIIGLSPRDDPAVPNPLWFLGAVGHSYVVHVDNSGTSNLILGAPPDGFTLTHLQPRAIPATTPATTAAGTAALHPGWRTRVPLCLTVTSPPGQAPVCTPTMFDTGTPSLATIRAAGIPAQQRLPAHSTVSLSTPDDSCSAAYTTRRTGGVTLIPATTPEASSVAGLPAFAQLDVRFDLAQGTIGLRNH